MFQNSIGQRWVSFSLRASLIDLCYWEGNNLSSLDENEARDLQYSGYSANARRPLMHSGTTGSSVTLQAALMARVSPSLPTPVTWQSVHCGFRGSDVSVTTCGMNPQNLVHLLQPGTDNKIMKFAIQPFQFHSRETIYLLFKTAFILIERTGTRPH